MLVRRGDPVGRPFTAQFINRATHREGDPPGRPYTQDAVMHHRFNPDIHHRRSIRLRDYDYARDGVYYVTVCVHGRECLFGEITDEGMRLSCFGEIVREEWMRSAEIRKEIVLDEFVVMPNHLHGIMVINGGVGATGPVARNGDADDNGDDGHDRATRREGDPAGRPYGPVSGSVGAIIGQFKSIATKRINALRDNPGCPVWQRNYHERVIRTERELAAIREYIVNNPAQWALDQENPANTM